MKEYYLFIMRRYRSNSVWLVAFSCFFFLIRQGSVFRKAVGPVISGWVNKKFVCRSYIYPISALVSFPPTPLFYPIVPDGWMDT